MTNHLIIFAKAPRYGAVKSRLARDIGCLAAWQFYRRSLASLIRGVGYDHRWCCRLAVTGGDARWPRALRRDRQFGADLGERMLNAMLSMPPGPVVLIGADIPHIEPQSIDAAFHALRAHDAVFGPAADGGFWLVGFRRPRRHRKPFKNVRWSSAYALQDTRANIKGRVAFIETLDDVDNGVTYARLIKSR